LLLGGDFPTSAWGDLAAAQATLDWIDAHPWLRPLNAIDLILRKANQVYTISPSNPIQSKVPNEADRQPIASGLTTREIESNLLEALQSAPDSPALDLAWQAYQALLTPVRQELPGLDQFRASALGQIGHLIAAARWSANPWAFCQPLGEQEACSVPVDPDWDGLAEVALASENFFGIIELHSGTLAVAFYRDEAGITQWVAPSSQFALGLADPMVWEPERALAGDPSGLPGGFADLEPGGFSPSWERYDASLGPGSVTLKRPSDDLEKDISIVDGALQVSYKTDRPVQVLIPLALEPESRFSPDWIEQYSARPFANGVIWGFAGGHQVTVTTSGTLSYTAFNDSARQFTLPEDPNYPFTPGHYLPMPMFLAQIDGEGEFWVRLGP
jgi:hypothetical protein